LITDIRDAVTHPAALRMALDEGWTTRVVNRTQGTFHPKVFIFSRQHRRSLPYNPAALLCGSNNLSKGGLHNNVEASMLHAENAPIAEAATLASEMWRVGQTLTNAILATYESRFRDRNSKRPVEDLRALGVSDAPNPPNVPPALQYQSPSFSRNAAQAAWAGLQSFTGEYTFQLEFPRDAAVVLSRLANAYGAGRYVHILCADGLVRPMRYAFYADNDMFRLNIPNDVPGITRARTRRQGVGLIELIDDARARLKLTVSDNSNFVSNVHGRSFALGTWGRTPTRLFGWY
jgi:hypothetical protein